ncbi:pectinesterase [Musa troglodytarum]|uniref:Pectinesterase n=2 Tax=Musa troglodytarum TaxID=320322 RepID=A0A9E7GWC3_9LILI|nr:pectinesterase [Musa troglodytarum]
MNVVNILHLMLLIYLDYHQLDFPCKRFFSLRYFLFHGVPHYVAIIFLSSLLKMVHVGSMSLYERAMMSRTREHKKKLVVWAFAVSLAIALSAGLSLKAIKQAGAKPKPLVHSLHSHNIVSRATDTSTAVTESPVASACKSTLYPEACEAALASVASTASTKEMFDVSVETAKGRARVARDVAYNLTQASTQKSNSRSQSSVNDCLELLDITLDQLDDVLHAKKSSRFHDVQTWLSAALTNQLTCSEGLETVKAKGGDSLNAQVESLSQYISNALALHKKVKVKDKDGGQKGGHGGRKLLSDGFPEWLSAGDRRLLQASPEDIRADAVVAKDGSGTHTTINEAIAFVSLASKGSGGGSTKVIYVKAGTYKEYINIPTKQKNVMLLGDGKGKSIVVGSRNANDGYTTYGSATVAAMGAGFIAKGLTIINNSGPSKHQAVALRVGADKSVVYQCSIQGYQDTLYTHSNRQFYTETDIYGTVDFIFGNSAVVLQNCYIQPRKPGGGQKNSVTAQGRTDPNQNTGISIQKCKIQGSSDLGSTPTYLGRPWQKYSRTVVMETYLDDSIDPDGWEPWSGSFALSTLYYGEYANTGPGASTSGRVGWAGVHPSLSSSEASKFTVAEFIVGDDWLPGTGVSYTAGL